MRCLTKVAVFSLFLLNLTSLVLAQDAREQALMEAIKANPKDATAHFNLGVALFNEQKYDAAIPEFQKCLEINSGDKQAKEMLESSEGISAYFQHNYSGAVDHLQNALKINPSNPNANLLLADSFVQLKQYPNAETALKNYSLTSPQGKEKASEVLSKIYMDQKRYAEAVTELKNIVAVNPKNFEAYQNLGVAYFQSKNYKDAANYWEKAVQLQKNAQVYRFLGFSYYNLGDFNDAIENYNKSIQMESSKDPKEQDTESLGETYYNLAVAYNDNSLYDKSAEAFGQAFKINPKDSNAAVGQAQAIEQATQSHMEKATNLFLGNQYSAAITEWQMVLKYQPDNKQATDFIADAKGKLGVEVENHYKAGKSFAQSGKTVQALNELNLAMQMDPSNEKVQKLLKTLIKHKKDRVSAYIAEGNEFIKENDYASAAESFQKAKEIDPRNSTVKKLLKMAMSNQTKELDSILKKAGGYQRKGDLKNAQKYFTMAKGIAPKDEAIATALFKVQKDIRAKVKDLDAQGISLFEGGDKEKAKVKFQEVLKLTLNDDTANDYMKKMIGQQSHEKADAEQVKALYYDGVNLYINGKIHEAIAKWQECLKQDPGNINAQKNIDKAMVKLQSIEKLSRN